MEKKGALRRVRQEALPGDSHGLLITLLFFALMGAREIVRRSGAFLGTG